MNTPTYEDTKVDLTINQIGREAFDNLSALEPNQLYFITSADHVVVDCDLQWKYVTFDQMSAYVQQAIQQSQQTV